MKCCGCTLDGGAAYRIYEKTGITRSVTVADMFGGAFIRKDEEVHVWNMLHPDEHAQEHVDSPYGANERPVGVGAYIGKEWK